MSEGLLFGFDYIIEELSAVHVLHNEEELFWGFDYFVELDYIGMPDQF